MHTKGLTAHVEAMSPPWMGYCTHETWLEMQHCIEMRCLQVTIYSSLSSMFAIFIRCACKPRFSAAVPWTGTEMRATWPSFA